MDRAGDDQQFLVVTLEQRECFPAQIAGMRLIAVDHQHRAVDLSGVGEKSGIHQGSLRIDRPSIRGIQ